MLGTLDNKHLSIQIKVCMQCVRAYTIYNIHVLEWSEPVGLLVVNTVHVYVATNVSISPTPSTIRFHVYSNFNLILSSANK